MTQSPTWYFNLHWSNDEPLYRAVLRYGGSLLSRLPNMTDQTLGRNVIDQVASWCADGGWGRPAGERPSGVNAAVLKMMAEEVGNFRDVNEEEVGEQVRESLGIEAPQEKVDETWEAFEATVKDAVGRIKALQSDPAIAPYLQPQQQEAPMRTWEVSREQYVHVEATTQERAREAAWQVPQEEWAWTTTRVKQVSTSDPGQPTDGHVIRPDDDPEPGDRCKECGRPITWIGPSPATDWEHVE